MCSCCPCQADSAIFPRCLYRYVGHWWYIVKFSIKRYTFVPWPSVLPQLLHCTTHSLASCHLKLGRYGWSIFPHEELSLSEWIEDSAFSCEQCVLLVPEPKSLQLHCVLDEYEGRSFTKLMWWTVHALDLSKSVHLFYGKKTSYLKMIGDVDDKACMYSIWYTDSKSRMALLLVGASHYTS